jgi:1-deoxy-D-xylulose-5-phosphate reductoisomerase
MQGATHHPVRRVLVLGSTGSIGRQTLQVLAHLNTLPAGDGPRYQVVGLAAGKDAALLAQQARDWGVHDVALADESGASALSGLRTLTGPSAALQLVERVEADIVVAAIVGSAGLAPTLAAAARGRDVLLANKEALVAAGPLMTRAAQASGAALLPIDSEHSALWQALGTLATRPPVALGPQVSRLILTASGGPFRDRTLAEVAGATVEQALNHPTWRMGAKVTLDSATLTNKALELIEAHWLFGVDESRLAVVIHPQSIVHSLVEMADGSVLAQLGSADMRGPIQYALTSPHRAPASAARLSLLGPDGRGLALDFRPACEARFLPLALARRVIRDGGTSGAIFASASEEAGALFLSGQVRFGDLPQLAAGAMDALGSGALRDLADAQEAERHARAWVRARTGAPTPPANAKDAPCPT